MLSLRELDTKLLAAEIEKLTRVKVGLRYKTIAMEAGVVLEPRERISAVHVEINLTTESFDRPRIEQLYNSKRKENWPLGVKMRLVPERRDTESGRSIAKINFARSRQEKFTKVGTKN